MCYELSTDLYREHHVLIGDTNNPLNNTVPLGDPLLDTCVELHDEQGSIITCGNGEICIGMKQAYVQYNVFTVWLYT